MNRPGPMLGAPTGHVRFGTRRSLLLHRRSLVVVGISLVVILAGTVASLTTGAYPVSLEELLAVFRNGGEDLAPFIVLQQRLPRVTGALVIGGMLGLSGALFRLGCQPHQ